jgi:hypothetical protein
MAGNHGSPGGGLRVLWRLRYLEALTCTATFSEKLMKNFLKNSALIIFSIALCLGFVEVSLRMDGRYHNLADQILQPSPAIWEAPANGVWFSKHPDLHVPIKLRFDRDGVRNHSELSTSEKQKIIGFFGDSFTENSQIEDRFTFTSILDIAAHPNARVVNYGVDGYGRDQEYLRYKKYEKQDIEHVVYVFCENDLRDLYTTGLTKIAQNGDIEFVERHNPLYRGLGRLHVTYLVITAYYKAIAFARCVKDRRTESEKCWGRSV